MDFPLENVFPTCCESLKLSNPLSNRPPELTHFFGPRIVNPLRALNNRPSMTMPVGSPYVIQITPVYRQELGKRPSRFFFRRPENPDPEGGKFEGSWVWRGAFFAGTVEMVRMSGRMRRWFGVVDLEDLEKGYLWRRAE
ncbi:hypothetical protein SBOR_9202 [Sclerotinia borealis F-4128]|uniref:Uncharacterized protein n=1 Tax=Sclerotinia borealis (strain F-4128) TaxID=1432307 RepID=W9C696_SCLBF|nr:hypothetical protein SBOR_9202 [Sclerotinia borealis F-4128]